MRGHTGDTTKTPARSAFASALRRLARRDHSEHEIRAALLKEGQTPADIDEAVEKLRAARYLDDRKFAERYTRSRLVFRGQGRVRIRQSLRTLGVDGELAERALRQAAEDGSERDALDAAARKYWRAHPRTEPALRIRRLFVFLMRRGFPAALVGERLRSLWPSQREAFEEPDAQEID